MPTLLAMFQVYASSPSQPTRSTSRVFSRLVATMFWISTCKLTQFSDHLTASLLKAITKLTPIRLTTTSESFTIVSRIPFLKELLRKTWDLLKNKLITQSGRHVPTSRTKMENAKLQRHDLQIELEEETSFQTG